MNATKRHKYTLTSILKLKLKLNTKYDKLSVKETPSFRLVQSFSTLIYSRGVQELKNQPHRRKNEIKPTAHTYHPQGQLCKPRL